MRAGPAEKIRPRDVKSRPQKRQYFESCIQVNAEGKHLLVDGSFVEANAARFRESSWRRQPKSITPCASICGK